MEFENIDFTLAAALALGLTLIVFAVILEQLREYQSWLGRLSFLIGDVAALIVAFVIIFIPLMCLFMFLNVLIARKR